MAKKASLTPSQMTELRKELEKGSRPDDLAKKFHIGIATVHNYKKRFKSEGAKILPSARGRKPIEMNMITVEPALNNPETNPKILGVISPKGSFKFIVNGVSVSVDPKARSITITEDSFAVDF